MPETDDPDRDHRADDRPEARPDGGRGSVDRSDDDTRDDGGDGPGLRILLAPNPSPLTLDGTRTFIVGRRHVGILDPGPAIERHIDAIIEAVGDAETATILLTHDHPDHAGAARELAARLGASHLARAGRHAAGGGGVRDADGDAGERDARGDGHVGADDTDTYDAGAAPVLAARDGSLSDGDRIRTDAGELVAVATPGHTPDHLAFHWPGRDTVFCGDLLMGGMETTLVAPPEGDLGDYLASLERVRSLRPRVIQPAHGPPFGDPDTALDAYVRHRESRERQVLDALAEAAGPASPDELVDAVYGTGLDPGLRAAARAATVAYLEHLEAGGAVRRAETADRWVRA